MIKLKKILNIIKKVKFLSVYGISGDVIHNYISNSIILRF